MVEYFALGLVGHPLSHSLSPVLHTAALRHANLEGEYRLFDVPPDSFDHDIANIVKQGIRGFNITIPYKQRVYDMISYPTEETLQAGAVNTVRIEPDGKFSGHNTDIIGFELAFKESFDMDDVNVADDVEEKVLESKTALVIGAGGAARAAVVALNRLGVETIKIKVRDSLKVHSFISDLENNAIRLSEDDVQDYEKLAIVVNASPIGLTDESVPDWLEPLVCRLPDECACFDLVYRKDKSRPAFSQLAEERNLRTVDGLSMLVHQARFAFEYWTGVKVPSRVMYEALKNSDMIAV